MQSDAGGLHPTSKTPHPLFTIGRIHNPGKPHAALNRAKTSGIK